MRCSPAAPGAWAMSTQVNKGGLAPLYSLLWWGSANAPLLLLDGGCDWLDEAHAAAAGGHGEGLGGQGLEAHRTPHVELLGGDYKIASGPGEGTRIRVRLPIKAP